MNVLGRLQAIFRDVFDDPKLVISPEIGPDQIADWDSVMQVNLVLAVEAEFEIRFTTDEIGHLRAVADFVRAIESRA